MKPLPYKVNPYASFAFSADYAAAYMALGIATRSWWFITGGACYGVLAVARFSLLQIRRRADGDYEVERFAGRFTGILLAVLAFCIVGINVLSIVEERGTRYHKIVMIAIAAYTFTRITLAIIEMVKAKRSPSPVTRALRNLTLSEAAISLYSMQRSMLATFPGMETAEIRILNVFTGSAVWLLVLLLGLNLIGGKYITMAKSKVKKAVDRMAGAVVDGYKKIETGVVEGYKKIEEGVVSGYTKIEDTFVETYLTEEGETVDEAKERLKQERNKK